MSQATAVANHTGHSTRRRSDIPAGTFPRSRVAARIVQSAKSKPDLITPWKATPRWTCPRPRAAASGHDWPAHRIHRRRTHLRHGVGRRGLAVVVLPLAFTLAWSIPAARSDETGLWLVGAVMILVGTLAGTAALASTSAAVRQRVDTGGEASAAVVVGVGSGCPVGTLPTPSCRPSTLPTVGPGLPSR